MTEEAEGTTIEDRFEALKTLLKEQIKANEILKYELGQLDKLYQAVCKEKSLLLNELLDNHSNCSNAVVNCSSTGIPENSNDDVLSNSYKRSISVRQRFLGDSISQVEAKTAKRSRIDVHPAKLSPHRDSPTSAGALESTFSQEPDPWHQQDDLDDIMPSITRPRGSALASSPSSTNPRNPNSRLQTLATQLNSSFSSAGLTEPSKPSPWQRQFNNSCSPPALTVATSMNQMQRPTKGASLVTSSTLTASGGPVSVVQRVGSSTKYLSPTNRNATGLLSTSALPKANLVINATLASGTTSMSGTNPKSLSSQGAPAYRLSCSSTGQRILIQPSEHGRQIRIQQSDTRISGLTEDGH